MGQERLAADLQVGLTNGRKKLREGLADVRKEIADVRKELQGGLADVRSEVALYHNSAVGHGILISGLDERVTRLENRRG